MAKNDVTIPMMINLRSSLVFGLVTRLDSMTGSFILSSKMVNPFKVVIAITAAKARATVMAKKNNVTGTLESKVVMSHVWLKQVMYQHKSFSPTKTVAILM